MNHYDDLPLFLLHTVLFPDTPLPLHIFEPRYLEMADRCVSKNAPFGVVLIESGREVGGPAVPYRVGTAARIVHYERLPNGCMNVVATGEYRFRILETFARHEYMTAKVEPNPENAGDVDELAEATDRARKLFRKYVRALLARVNRQISSLQIPTGPLELSYSIANVLQIPLTEKQSLLESHSILDRLHRETEILMRETESPELLAALPDSDVLLGPQVTPVNHESLRSLISRN